MVFKNEGDKAKKASPDEIKNIKGKKVTVAGASNNEWALTAEHSGTEAANGVGNLVAEFIVNGLVVKLGQNKAEKIGKEITAFLEKWKPNAKDGTKLKIDGYEAFGEWTVAQPMTWINAKTPFWSASCPFRALPFYLQTMPKLRHSMISSSCTIIAQG